MLSTKQIEQILAAAPERTVGLLGDLFLDRYLDIDPARDEPSVETGLTAYQVTRVRSYPGALGTVINNLAALGVGRIVPIAVIGDDGEGYELRQALKLLPGVDQSGLITAADRRTPTYTKPMYGSKELNRFDIKNRTHTPAALEDAILERLHAAWSGFDALIVLDQVSEEDCGVVTKRVRDGVAKLAALKPSKFVLADSRERIGLFRHVSVKPNQAECLAATGLQVMPDKLTFEPLDLSIQVGGAVFCTAGPEGIVYVPHAETAGTSVITKIAAYPVSGPIDVCGAGDSCSAGIVCAKVAGLGDEAAAAFGNLVASITVQQIGTTGTAPPVLVRKRWKEVSG